MKYTFTYTDGSTDIKEFDNEKEAYHHCIMDGDHCLGFKPSLMDSQDPTKVLEVGSIPTEGTNMKCITEGCKNEYAYGAFIGTLCVPCHDYYTEFLAQSKKSSQAYRNFKKICKNYLKECEIYQVTEKYK